MKARNNVCPICNKVIYGGKNMHHIFNGPYKAKSEQDSFLVNLHPSCHIKLHNNPDVAKELKEKCQRKYEMDHTREEFIERYGKSYL